MPSLKFGYFPKARAAHIEEMDDEQEYQDYEEDEVDVASHAARTARLSDEQKDEWVNELSDRGINFS